MKERIKTAIERYLPEQCADPIACWVIEYKVHLRISRPRNTKLGDYRPPYKGKTHRISVNGDLNRYAFLITLIHEFAHLITWEKHRGKVLPHGLEWKSAFQDLMVPFLGQKVFPDDIELALLKYLSNPAASSCTDAFLVKSLKKYDNKNEAVVFLEDLPEHALFLLGNNRVFRKGDKLRKRFKCQEMQTKRYYLINALAEVRIVDKL